MEYKSNSPEETFALGKQLGEQAKPGEVYCLDGDLGVGKTIFTQGFAAALALMSRLTARPLPLCSSMTADAFPCITLMCTASGMSARWMRLAMRTAFTERVSA